MLSSEQIRMARAALRWSTKDLAEKSGVGFSTIQRMETFDGMPDSRIKNLKAIRDTFLATGRIRFEGETGVFVEENE